MDMLLARSASGRLPRCPCGHGPPVTHDLLTRAQLSRLVPSSPIRATPFDPCDRVLTEHCPWCDRAFYDFDGCAALLCSCGGAFCALCLHPCADMSEAHAHVRECSLHPTRDGDYFVSTQAYEGVRARARSLRAHALVERTLREDGALAAAAVASKLHRRGGVGVATLVVPHALCALRAAVRFLLLVLSYQLLVRPLL